MLAPIKYEEDKRSSRKQHMTYQTGLCTLIVEQGLWKIEKKNLLTGINLRLS